MAAEETYPTDLRYHPEHDWVRAEGDEVVFGVTWYAQDAMGEVVYYDPPAVGATVTKDAPYGELESVKAVSDIIAPASGEVLAVNPAVADRPEVVNEDPYGEGWLVRVRLSDPAELDDADGRAGLPRLPGRPVSRYTSLTDDDLRVMLAEIGVSSIDELFATLPEGVRLDRALDLPTGLPEQDVLAHLSALAARNVSADDEITFLGAGMYDHYVPALIDSILSRSEFLTPYTPYQPEISQGGLQVMFEYQTAISELTGLPVSNASVYEGPSAVGAAAYLARLANGRRDVVVSRGVHPHSRGHARRRWRPATGRAWSRPPCATGSPTGAALAALIGPDTAAVIVQQPNFLGAVEDLEPLVAEAKAVGALVVCACDPLPLAILRSPGELGVDVAVGEGQTLGNRLDYGGPSFGFFAASQEHIRRMPGRIAGRDPRRRRPARLRADAADPRAAHPAREGDQQHLHRPGAQRPGRRHLPVVARQARARSSWPS